MSPEQNVLDLAKRWVNALAAPISFAAASTTSPRGFVVRGGRGDPVARRMLSDMARISGRRDALQKLPLMLTDGVQAGYDKHRAWSKALPPEARSMGTLSLDAADQTGRAFVRAHGGGPAETSVVAHDTAGLAHLAGLAYGSAYLAEHEAWALLARAATAARAVYGSWDEYGRGFLYGSWYLAGYVDAGFLTTEKAMSDLLTSPMSPWSDLPWGLDLQALAELTVDAGDPGGALRPLGVRVVVDCPECLAPTLLADASLSARCHACAASLDHLTSRAWALATRLGDQEDKDAEGVRDEQAERSRAGVQQATLLDHPRTRVAYSRTAVRCECGKPLRDALLRASVARGFVVCGCGLSAPLCPAPAAIRAADFRARYVLGGPLRWGAPEGFLTILFSQG